MCLLTYYPEGVDVDTEALANGAMLNRDGYGFAIVDGGRIIVGKDMNADKAIDRFEELRATHRGHALFHSRMATAGKHSTDNCHPFHVGGSPLTVVGHNGIMPARLQPLKGDPRSDTAIFAEHDLPGRNLDRERNRNRLAKFLGRGNKIVVLTVDTSYKNSAYVINEQYGKWDNGAWYSNDGYLPYVPYSSYGGWSGEWEHSTTCRCWECDGGEYPGDYKGARHYDWARYVAHCMAELVKLGQDEMNLKPWEVLQAFSEDETILLANHVRASLEKARAEQAEKSCATGDVLFCRVCGETSPPTPLFSCPTCQHCFECKRDVETACECWTHSTETVDST